MRRLYAAKVRKKEDQRIAAAVCKRCICSIVCSLLWDSDINTALASKLDNGQCLLFCLDAR